VGKPRSGEIFRNKQQAKYEYKYAFRTKETASREQFTDELNDALANKDSSSFWKTWQSKFSRKRVSPVISGICDPTAIAEKFANLFETVFAPSFTERHRSLRAEFYHRFPRYNCGVTDGFQISVELVEQCICELKRGKAADMDGLTAEHLFYAHPVFIPLLSCLFQLIVHFGLVPTDFACGLIIPLVKNSDGDIKFSNNYCGITLNPVVSSVRTGVDGNGW